MQKTSILLFSAAVIAGIFSFSDIDLYSMAIARLILAMFVILFVASLIGKRKRAE